jgi:hypothetical protein
VNQTEPSPHVLTFTDLIYAALSSYALPLFDSAADRRDKWAVGYLAVAAIWMFYDWYANHYFGIDANLGARNIPLDLVSFFQYAGLLYTAARTSPWVHLFLAIRGARGIAYNEIALRTGKGPRDPERLRSYNYSSGFMVVTYSGLLVFELSRGQLRVGERLIAAIAIWLMAYGIALFVEWRLDRLRAKRLPAAAASPWWVVLLAFGVAAPAVLRRNKHSAPHRASGGPRPKR